MSTLRSELRTICAVLRSRTQAVRLLVIQSLAALLLALMSSSAADAQLVSFSQQGPKLVGADAAGTDVQQGRSVSASADGNTIIIGANGDDGGVGAAWVWTRTGGVWTQQGPKLVGTGAVGTAWQGYSVALSADGNTAIVGGPADDHATGDPAFLSDGKGAAWIWTRTAGVWTQQGPKLVGAGATGSYLAKQGFSVSLSADGNTALVGGIGDNDLVGAAWVWTRTGGVWTQQGSKLVGSGAVGPDGQGFSVALSADGYTALVGSEFDQTFNGAAAWFWTQSGGVWTQQGPMWAFGEGEGAIPEISVSLSADGSTALVGRSGGAWVLTRTSGVWTLQGPKLVGSDLVGAVYRGMSVALSADGNTALVGGAGDRFYGGAAWVWTRIGGVWRQQGSKLVGTGAVGLAAQGSSVALSADGRTAIVGGVMDNANAGAAWVFLRSSSPAMSLDMPVSGASVGTSFTVAGWAADLDAGTGTGVDTVHVWAFPGSGSPIFVGVATYGGSRTDVGAAFGSQFTNSGFGLTVTSLPIGTYTLVAYAHSTITGTFNQSRSATVTVVSLPAMSLDAPASLGTVGSSFYAAGWAINQGAAAGTGVDAVHVWAYPNPGSGQPPVFLGVASYGGTRGDVGAAFGAQFTNSGFFLTIASLSPGTYRIAAYAHSTVTATFNNLRTADVTVAGPLMAIDAPGSGTTQSGPFVVAGWALDRSAASGTGVNAINIWAFPVAGGPAIFAGSGGYGAPRQDLAAIFGSQFANSGYNTWVSLPNGTASGDYDFVVYAHSTITGTFNQSHTVRVTVH